MPGLIEEIRRAHDGWHEGTGKRQRQVQQTVVEVAAISDVLYLSGGVYVRTQREGQTAKTAPIRWHGTDKPVVGDKTEINRFGGKVRKNDVARPAVHK